MRSAAFAIVLVCGCSRGEPPAPAGIDAAIAPLPAPVPSSSVAVAVGAAPAASAPIEAGAPKTEGGSDAGDPGALPQNKDRPKAEGALFTSRSTALWEA